MEVVRVPEAGSGEQDRSSYCLVSLEIFRPAFAVNIALQDIRKDCHQCL